MKKPWIEPTSWVGVLISRGDDADERGQQDQLYQESIDEAEEPATSSQSSLQVGGSAHPYEIDLIPSP